jgi:hypothetical protein
LAHLGFGGRFVVSGRVVIDQVVIVELVAVELVNIRVHQAAPPNCSFSQAIRSDNL